MSSTYFEGKKCPLAKFGHSRDDKKSKLQTVFGLLCAADGCPVAVVWAEDNYGHLCQVPTASEAARSGGNGVYYHSSYSGWHDLWVYRSDASVMFDRIVIETTAGAVGNGLVGPVESPNNIARGDAVQAAKIAALPAAITGPGSLR